MSDGSGLVLWKRALFFDQKTHFFRHDVLLPICHVLAGYRTDGSFVFGWTAKPSTMGPFWQMVDPSQKWLDGPGKTRAECPRLGHQSHVEVEEFHVRILVDCQQDLLKPFCTITRGIALVFSIIETSKFMLSITYKCYEQVYSLTRKFNITIRYFWTWNWFRKLIWKWTKLHVHFYNLWHVCRQICLHWRVIGQKFKNCLNNFFQSLESPGFSPTYENKIGQFYKRKNFQLWFRMWTLRLWLSQNLEVSQKITGRNFFTGDFPLR